MKKLIIFFIVIISSLTTYSQLNSLDVGNDCFKKGDYSCAESNYKEAYKNSIGKEKQIAEIKLQRAKRCNEILKKAELLFKKKNYANAKLSYLSILESNPDDSYVKNQLELIANYNTRNRSENGVAMNSFSLSEKDLNFGSSAGNKTISVFNNSRNYEISLLPSWCSIKKYNNYFFLYYNENNSATERTDYFNVISGSNVIRVNIKQEAKIQKSKDYLIVSKTYLSFPAKGGNDEKITIRTNLNNFTVPWFPNWCSVKIYDDYIIVSCKKNHENKSRSDWFKIIAGGEQQNIYVSQEQNKNSAKNIFDCLKKPLTRLYSFKNLGFQSGSIAKFGIIYESGGKKTVGFRITARTSLTAENDIINGRVTKNKSEIELGPNFRLSNRVYLNIGLGHGSYQRIYRNDYAGQLYTQKTGYFLFTAGTMYRVSRLTNINAGLSFMDIDKDFYKPEFTFGISFNIKNKYKY